MLLAHVVASVGVLLAMNTLYDGAQRPEILLVAPVWAPHAVWDVTRNPKRFRQPAKSVALVDGSYLGCFGATLAWRRVSGRDALRSRRRRCGLCTECGYNLTGNVSGMCPECGVDVNPKARTLVRRSR
jgi:hypothetical protein